MPEYDAVVIGLGTAGGSALWPLHRHGLKVAAIEKELVGGLCAYWGCMPSKTLLRPGDIEWQADHGFGTSEPLLAWPEVARYRDEIVRDWDDSKQVEQLRHEGIDFFRGEATVIDSGKIQINGETLSTKRVIVAVGTVPTIPPIEGLAEIEYWTNREGTSFHEVPKSVLVVGGGAIGCELGQVLHSFGATVTIVEAADQLLGHEAPEAARYLEERFTGIGIKLYLGRKTTKFEEGAESRIATLDNGEKLSAEVVLVATSRHAEVKSLGLENVGVKTSKKGIEIDEYCRAAENVWAVGDVTGVAGFTHVADYQGRIASDDILGRARRANYSSIPAVTFSDPEVASVGTTSQAQAPEGMELISAQVELAAAARTSTYGRDYRGGLCLTADRANKVLVGAWAVGPSAGEWIQLATLAIRAKVPVEVLDDTMFAFPTFTRLYLEPIQQLQQKLNSGA